MGMNKHDLGPVRAAGLSGRAMVDPNQVVPCLNHVNRSEDGLGVAPGP
jgi:hypothetical protein